LNCANILAPAGVVGGQPEGALVQDLFRQILRDHLRRRLPGHLRIYPERGHAVQLFGGRHCQAETPAPGWF
jgi:hypothetical protein